LKQKRCGNNRLRRAKQPRKRSGKKSSGGDGKKMNRGESCPHQLLLEELVELGVEQG
jgi:hypothetical protein